MRLSPHFRGIQQSQSTFQEEEKSDETKWQVKEHLTVKRWRVSEERPPGEPGSR